ncbi:topless-related protein 1 [Artemisia annua]|uniref:Topless-related protein 1 n=1 Tax=Artemisia annua TaxID=35608 RepID=A0A2U1PQB6_ARTAN|nr:topless-related protein 1 [Artemisia annua]
MCHFQELVMSGHWKEVEKYLAAFTKIDDNKYSMKIYFEIRKQKYLEALDKKNRAAAIEILMNELKVFASFNEDLYKEIALLLPLENFSLNWQHQLCQNPNPNPDIKTLFVDHTCEQSQPNGAHTPSPVTNPPLGAHGAFQSVPAPMPSPLAGPSGLAPAMVKSPRSPPTNNQTADSEHVLKRKRTLGISDENGDNPSPVDIKPKIEDITMENSKIWKSTEITEPAQCRSIRLPDDTSSAIRVSRLIYTNSGLGILALDVTAVHKFWKWTSNDPNLTAKATANVIPQLWQPTSGILMANVVTDANIEDAVPCIALSKNDSYVVSASGGTISLFNMMTLNVTCFSSYLLTPFSSLQ